MAEYTHEVWRHVYPDDSFAGCIDEVTATPGRGVIAK